MDDCFWSDDNIPVIGIEQQDLPEGNKHEIRYIKYGKQPLQYNEQYILLWKHNVHYSWR